MPYFSPLGFPVFLPSAFFSTLYLNFPEAQRVPIPGQCHTWIYKSEGERKQSQRKELLVRENLLRAMALSVTCYMLLQLFLLVNANNVLTINPQNPVVPLGGSIKLNCSINNLSCTTNWKGLDTNLGSVYSAPGYSVLTIENASILMDGNKICVNTCPNRRSRLESTMNLQVYALPETLHLSTSITDGIPYFHCLINGVRPIDSIEVQCYRGSEKLDNYSMDTIQDEDWDIYNVTWSWEISNENLKSQTLYSCEVELNVGEQTFRRVGTLEIPEEVGTTVTLARTVTNTENQNTAKTTRAPETFSTATDSTTLYTRTPQKKTPSPPSTIFSSLTAHKQLPTSDTVRTTDPLAVTVINTENQSTVMSTRTPTTQRTLSTLAAYTEFSSLTTLEMLPPSDRMSKADTLARIMTNTENQGTTMSTPITSFESTDSTIEKTSSPPSTSMFSKLTTRKELPTPDMVRTTDQLAVTVINTENQSTVMSTRTLTTQRTLSTLAAYTEFSSLPTQEGLPPSDDRMRTTDQLAVTVINTENQTTVMSTRTPTTQRTLSTLAAYTEFSSLPTLEKLPPSDRNYLNIMWMALPAAGLAGSILIFLQIWRHLNKTGFFQPNQLHWSDCKHGAKDLVHGLETGSPHYGSVK